MTRQAREQFTGSLAMLLTYALGAIALAAFAGGVLVPIAAVLVIAFAKGRLVILDFMELRQCRGGLRLALLAWPAVLLGLALVRTTAVALLG